ncbi:AbrB family transcriptional regulator [Oceanobacillus halophilus]|uniref:AbrB family transcriptional regulator n=1 Tax=Oceanobacillus halophilus TaxID=930130 RepID=A0A494ZXN1_9BACI|nr:AbrB family transcriptional regulator [Oceanobacillus halophilus]RKQ31503.1 AbrB family transcriptional regulator [Oceanobacillus halophilus]
MDWKSYLRLGETLLIAFIGGFTFNLLHFPLAYVLGALTFISLWQGFTKRTIMLPISIKNAGFIVLGIYFGLYFTKETFQTILPYLLPYLLMTTILIVVSVLLAVLVSRYINVDEVTSVFASIPGGLSEMAIASESLKANSSLVVIFQTIRLITVLFTIPPFMTFLFNSQEMVVQVEETTEIALGISWNYLWFVLPVIAALFIKDRIPAGIIIGALGVTALLNISPVELAEVPSVFMNGAQILVGAGLGKNILFRDIKLGGKYTVIYFGLSVTIIVLALGLGILLANITSLSYTTAILGIAPGGFFEMVLTSYSIGGDPAVVSAFQLLRILLIVTAVPPILKWWFRRRVRGA